jgi:hypothetical protein
MSNAWKDLERSVAKKLGGRRKLRGADFSQKDSDVDLPDFPHWKLDAKYRAKQAHHKLLREVREKYCKSEHDMPVLITKAKGERGAVVCLDLDDFVGLVGALRGLKLYAQDVASWQ